MWDLYFNFIVFFSFTLIMFVFALSMMISGFFIEMFICMLFALVLGCCTVHIGYIAEIEHKRREK